MTFLGYPRPDGSVGIRNYILLIPGGLAGAKICDFVEGTKTIPVAPDSYFDHTSRDREMTARVLIGLGRNPNVAAVIMLGSKTAAQYDELHAVRIADEIAQSGKRVEFPDNQAGGTLNGIAAGIKLAREMVHEASKIRREPFDLSQLTVGTKCGASDTTSGLAGNPVIGSLYDRLVAAGGTAMLGENTEIIGAEHVLSKRGINPDVSRQILAVADESEERAKATGEDIRTINPVPANIAGGISTLEEKSLGAIAKSGTAPIQGVLKYGERPPGKGLYFVDNNPGMGIFTGYAAAGAQLLMFQFGGGGVGDPADTAERGASGKTDDGGALLSTSPGIISPMLWATANPNTLAMAGNSIDFFSGPVLLGQETTDEAAERLLQLIVDIASGTFTKVETIKHADPTQFYFKDPIF